MLALLVGLLLVQSMPASAELTPTTAAPAPSVTLAPILHVAPIAPIGGAVRRPPQTTPRMVPDAAFIRNSGSTNAAGYAIELHPDGTAYVTQNGRTVRKTVARAQTRWFFAKLRETGPLDAMPGGACMKSVSFGTSTVVTFGGRTSPDLSCGETPTARELLRTVYVIVDQLAISTRRPRLPIAR
jgi:hypothetical protein